jgi:hypothetical protein
MPTPAPYNNKCGLINIKMKVMRNVKRCVKYHQTKQEKHDDRVSVLKKVVDKYSYDDMNFQHHMKTLKHLKKIIKYLCLFIALVMIIVLLEKREVIEIIALMTASIY